MADEMAGKILRVGLAPGGFTRVCLLRVGGPNTMREGFFACTGIGVSQLIEKFQKLDFNSQVF